MMLHLTCLWSRKEVPLDSLIISFPLQKCTTRAPKTWLTLPLHQCRSLFHLQFLLLLHLLLMSSFNRASGICNNRSSICTHSDRYILVRLCFNFFFFALWEFSKSMKSNKCYYKMSQFTITYLMPFSCIITIRGFTKYGTTRSRDMKARFLIKVKSCFAIITDRGQSNSNAMSWRNTVNIKWSKVLLIKYHNAQ